MKKFLFLSLFMLTLSFASHAQFGAPAAFPLAAGDTLNNTDTVAKVIKATAGYSVVGIQVNLNKLSGTVAGKVYVYASMDSRNYAVIDSASYTAVPAGASGSVFGAIGSYTHTAILKEDRTPYAYYLVAATSSGTVSAPVQVVYTLRKYSTTQ